MAVLRGDEKGTGRLEATEIIPADTGRAAGAEPRPEHKPPDSQTREQTAVLITAFYEDLT